MSLKTLITAGLVMTVIGCASSNDAQAGQWRLDPRKCPDLREDIRDARVVTGRRDLREDRRDRRVTNCPASAWVYVPGRFERAHAKRPNRPGYTSIYINKKGHYYGVHGKKNVRIKIVKY